MREDATLQALLAAVAARDESALRRLYDLTAPKLYGVIVRIQRDRSLAEDVLQDVYLKVWQAAGSYVPASGRPMPWLCAIARNRAIDGLRRKADVQAPVSESGEDWMERLADPSAGEGALLDRDALLTCLGRLEATQRECVVLAYCEGWSREELAQRLDRPVNTIKTWLHRTLAVLKGLLGRRAMSGSSSIPPGERDGLAAEYVLGTLPVSERAAVEAERQVSPPLDFAIRDWERRFAPLSLVAKDEVPPARVWQAIERALAFAGPIANDNRVSALQRQVRRWRLGAMGAGLAAAGLALALLLPMRPGQEVASGRYVAVVTSGGELPALIVNVDTGTGTAQVRPVRAEAPSGRSLELWYVGTGKAPKTLGLIKAGANQVALPVDAAVADGMFAVSVEPTAGSPTGQPTGPVIYSGKLIQN